jgi:predicted dehydrogenase
VSAQIARSAHVAGSDEIRVGLIGCGGRGTGAAAQAVSGGENVHLVAMADAFRDRLESSRKTLRNELSDKCQVDDDHCFVGFDAYKQLIASDVDLVLLCTPPHFRPAQLAAAVAAGKHVFAEKPVAVDAPGVRSVLASCEQAKQRKLAIVSGLCWRYDYGVRETMSRIHDGAVGKIVSLHSSYNTHGLWVKKREPEWSDMEWQMRNWLYFTWLSGDHNVEQHVHSLDKMAWAMKDEYPRTASGMGGRQVRTAAEYGHIFDHHAVVYEFAGGVRLFSFCRQIDGCENDVTDHVFGSQGVCRINGNKQSISGERDWRYRGKQNNMYQTEHDELIASIRSGSPINNGDYMTKSTLMAIMGRMATYTGKSITWEQALNSQEDLTPPKYEWGPLSVAPVATPGSTPFV